AVDRAEAGPYRDARFSRQDLRELEYASLLHDFGKIGVREQVLVKARKLYDSQLELIAARFDYLRKSIELEATHRRLEALSRGDPPGVLDALAAETRERLAELDGFWDTVTAANEPTVL